MMAGPGGGDPGGEAGPGMPGMPGGMPGLPGGGGPLMPGARKTKPRYEFVACFIWREPTPTDPTPTADAAATTTIGGEGF